MLKPEIVYPFPMHLSHGYTYHLSILQFVHALSKLTTVHLLSLDTEDQLKQLFTLEFGYELNENLKIYTIKNAHLGIKSNSIFFRMATVKILKNLSRRTSDITVYTRNVKIASFLFPLKKKQFPNLKFVFECHQIFSINLAIDKKFQQARREHLLETKVYENADAVFVNTTLLKSLLNKYYNCKTIKLPLASLDSEKMHKSSNTTNRFFDFVYVGSFSSWKGVSTFVDALSILKNNGWKGHALLVGFRDSELTEWDIKIKLSGLSDQVKLVPRVARTEIKTFLDQSKIGVIPNSLEGDSLLGTTPLKLYDYASRGLPIVCSRVPALYSEIFLKDVSWTDPEHAPTMADDLEKAMLNYRGPSKSNAAWAANHTWEARARKVLDTIQTSI